MLTFYISGDFFTTRGTKEYTKYTMFTLVFFVYSFVTFVVKYAALFKGKIK